MYMHRWARLVVCLLTLLKASSSFPIRPASPLLRKTQILSSCNSSRTSSGQNKAASTALLSKDNKDLWESLLERFQGDFDNFAQVRRDREQGLLPREGGGHEHIHCTLLPTAKDSRLAAFYFDGRPEAIFRFRYYHLIPNRSTRDGVTESVDTVLYTLHPELEGQLRAAEPAAWCSIFESFSSSTSKTTVLPKCNVRWSCDMHPEQHKYALQHHDHQDGIHAVMVHGQAVVDSQMQPGQKILIKDQLSLWNDELWIHDRGYDPETMAFIYGNQRGVPYQLERVAKFSDSQKRCVVNSNLQWTLGANYRTQQEYEEKIASVGGPSIPQRPKK